MIYLLQWYWGWLLLALILGGLVGFYTVEREFKPENPLWWLPIRSRWILAIFVFGAVVAIMDWFPGRLAFYLDTALLFFVFYLIGCLLGGLLPDVVDRWNAARTKSNQQGAVTSTTETKTTAGPAAHAPTVIPDGLTGPILPSTQPPPADKPSESRSAGDSTIDYPGKMPPSATDSHVATADDLKLIKGVGPANESALHDLGVFRFSQIAAWTSEEVTWIEHRFAFPGRILRERWVDQATLLTAGVETEYSLAVRRRQVVPQDSAVSEEELRRLNLPQISPPRGDEAAHPGKRPLGLTQPGGNTPDDLKRIRGVAPENEQRLHDLGIWHFAQIAAWKPQNVEWVGSYLAFPGRIERERWVEQAGDLVRGTEANETQS
jgi:predicted flap endonuclease-1-like 5' DNA nuclease